MRNIIKSLVRSYFSVQIFSFWGLLLEHWIIFDPFWPLGCPKREQNLWFVLIEWHFKICDHKLYLSAYFKLLGIIFRGMDNCWPFCPLPSPLTPRVPKNGSKKWFDENKWYNQIPHAKLSIYGKFQLLGIMLLEVANFGASLLTPFWSSGARKWPSHGKSLWV